MTGKALPGGSPGKKAMEAVGSEGVPVGLDGEEVDCWFVGGTTRFVPSGTQAKLVHFSFEASEDVQVRCPQHGWDGALPARSTAHVTTARAHTHIHTHTPHTSSHTYVPTRRMHADG